MIHKDAGRKTVLYRAPQILADHVKHNPPALGNFITVYLISPRQKRQAESGCLRFM